MNVLRLDVKVCRVYHGARLFCDEDNLASLRVLREQHHPSES